MDTLKTGFFNLIDALNQHLQGNEVLLSTFRGENSDFVRLNRNLIRQAGSVQQYEVGLQLVKGLKHCSASINISGHYKTDLAWLKKVLMNMRKQLNVLCDDPFLCYQQQPESTEDIQHNELPDAQLAVDRLIQTAGQMDLVGLYASGTLSSGFANSIGQRNWHVRHNFNLDWSCYLNTDKAVKSRYAGQQWDDSKLDNHFAGIEQQLSHLGKKPVSLKPGRYRAYLSPDALSEILGITCWGGFSLKSHKSKSSPLLKLNQGEYQFDQRINISEENQAGYAPCFTSQGFIKPDSVSLISSGQRANYLVSPRSAMEYQQQLNSDIETPQSISLKGGELNPGDRLLAIDDGLCINNLWYSNFSDRNECRITGMTRFACFQVKNGRITAPVNVMRFDQSLFDILGDSLLDLDVTSLCLVSTDTYHSRSRSSMTLPGILIDGFELTF